MVFSLASRLPPRWAWTLRRDVEWPRVRSTQLVAELLLECPELLEERIGDVCVLGVVIEIRQFLRVISQVIQLPVIQLAVEVDELEVWIDGAIEILDLEALEDYSTM